MSSSTENPFARYELGARSHVRTKFADLPGVTSLPVAEDGTRSTGRLPLRPAAGRLTPPGIASAPVSALPPVAAVLSTDHLSATTTGTEPVTQRLTNIDYRLAVTEKSMKALVFEVVRLQGALGAALRAAEDDRMARLLAENRLRASSDAVGQLAVRLDKIERRRGSDDETNAGLMEHLRNVEAGALAAQQDTVRRHDQHTTRLKEVRDVIAELSQRLDAVEYKKTETDAVNTQRVNTIKGSVERHTAASLEAVRSLEARLAEVDESVNLERSRMQDRVADIDKNVNRRMTNTESKNNEMDTRLVIIVFDNTESKNNEMDTRLVIIEKAVNAEKESFEAALKATREQVESRFDSFFKLNEAEVKAVQDLLEFNKKKTNRNLHRLNEAVELIDKQLQEQKKISDNLLAAEIMSRKQLDQTRDNKLSELDSLTKQLHSTVNDLIVSKMPKMTDDLKEEIESLKTRQNRSMFELRASVSDTAVNGMKELVELRSKHGQAIDDLAARLAGHSVARPAPQLPLDKDAELYEKMTALESWRAEIEETVKRLEQEVNSLQSEKLPELDARCESQLTQLDAELKEESKNRESAITKCTTQIGELKTRIATETRQRKKDVDSLRQFRPVAPPGDGSAAATGWQEDIAQIEEKLKKMAETVQIVRTVLGMKIQSESRKRSADIENIEAEIEQLRADIAQLHDKADENNEGQEDIAQVERLLTYIAKKTMHRVSKEAYSLRHWITSLV